MAAPPSFAHSIRDIQEAILPLILPPASTFTAPLLEKFAASHDPLMESGSLFSSKADLGSIHVDLDATLRTLSRNAAAEEKQDSVGFGTKDLSSDTRQLLETVRQTRLRSKLRSMSGVTASDLPNESPRTHVSITRSSRKRKEAFDNEMDREEVEALEDFKRQLREAVLQT